MQQLTREQLKERALKNVERMLDAMKTADLYDALDYAGLIREDEYLDESEEETSDEDTRILGVSDRYIDDVMERYDV
jgi:hypothetical protein